MRGEGRSYREIRSVLGVSTSTLSLWLRNVPLTEAHRAALLDRRQSAVEMRAAAIRAASQARQRRLMEQAAGQIAAPSQSELFIAGVVAYWAEGAKTEPWGKRSSVRFTNSDPGMVKLFLRGWHSWGSPETTRRFR